MKLKISLIIIPIFILTISCTKNKNTNIEDEDIEAVIKLAENRYPKNENVKNAVIQYAKATLLNLKNPEGARKMLDQDLKTLACLYFVTKGDYSFFQDLEKEMINTPEKNYLYLKYNASSSGLTFSAPYPTKNDCDFKIK